MPTTESYAAGFIGVVTTTPTSGTAPPATDWHISEWDATFTTEWAETTNTGGFDVATGRCWESSIPTTCKGNGSFTFFLDLNNPPWGHIEDGKTLLFDFTSQVGQHITGILGIDSFNVKQGGVKGVFSVTVNFHTIGKVTFPVAA
jgi:hypothetical protein